jgi:HEAT repeat protein
MDDLVDMEATVLASFPQDLNSYKSWLRIKTPVCQEKDGCEAGGNYPEELKTLEKILYQRSHPAKLRGLAAISLGLSRYRQAGFELLKLVQSPIIDDLVAWCAIEALAEFPDPKVRQQAFEIAQQYGSRHFMTKPPRYRARFIYLLGWLSEEGCSFQPGMTTESPSQVILKKALKDQHAIVRGFAIEAMVRLNLKDTRLVVEKILGSENMLGAESEPLVLRKAAEALGQVGTLDSISVLENIMKADVAQTNQSVRSAYRYAIQEIQKRYGI